ncbi:MAG: cobalamin-dependent protein [Planctomycetes bacterium]|nr:cobalamin-dependent protein [Planctomycetota bacterium]
MLRVMIIAANQERMPDPIPPIGAAYIAAAARQAGHITRIYDACFAAERYAEELAAELAAFRPDVIGLSIRNVDNVAFPNVTCYLDRYQRIVAVCREVSPKATLFVGGSAFSLFPEEFAQKLDVDFGIVGEGENVFVQMLGEIDREGRVVGDYAGDDGVVFPGKVANLDAAVDPARDLLDVSRYFAEGGSINIQTKRGCVYGCIYCTYPVLEGKQVRMREPTLVVDEIQRAVEQHGVDFFFFVDNVFNYPAEHCEAICREILRRDLRVRWTAYVTPANCTREMFELMRASGCQSMDFGTDCFSDPQLLRMGKSFDVEQVFRVSQWARELGIKFNHSLILGGPGETWETLRETVENTVRSQANAVIAIIGVRLYRDTPMARYAIGRGLVTREEIGITPMFFISEEIRDGVVDYLAEVATTYKNWIVPGIKKGMNQRFFTRVRSRGVKGPLWELFEPMEYEGLPAGGRAGEAMPPATPGYVGGRQGIFRGADDEGDEQQVTELLG